MFVKRDLLNVIPLIELVGDQQAVAMLLRCQQTVNTDAEPHWTGCVLGILETMTNDYCQRHHQCQHRAILAEICAYDPSPSMNE